MKRRDFIKNTGMASLSVAAFPYILPTGRLFAPTGKRLANHVVFCLFAGGIRTFESIGKSEGNLLPNMLNGNETISKDIKGIMDILPGSGLQQSIQSNGTLFKNFKFDIKQTIHISAHAAAITGVYSPNMEVMKPLKYPSVFEYYRKHSAPEKSATSAWWISDQAGPFVFLNYSNYPGYGPLYGANMLQPSWYFNSWLNNRHDFSYTEGKNISELKAFFNQHAQIDAAQLSNQQIQNTLEERKRLNSHLVAMNKEYTSPDFNPWSMGKAANEDAATMYGAISILKEFKPELLVVNMQHSDIGHKYFSQYCNNMHKADFCVSKLWSAIQSTPGLANDTVLIVAPEFGRDLKPNTLIDELGRFAIDHSGDEICKQIFCLIAGPEGVVKQNQEISDTPGQAIDIVPTIAKILGFYDDIPKGILQGRILEEAFV